MLKPYYLKLIYVDYNNGTKTAHIEQQNYTHADSAQFLNHNFILGASTWTRSLPEIEYVPGGYMEFALAIIPGKKVYIQEITLGVNCSLYYKQLPIMTDQTTNQWQVCLFAGLAVGKRWK